MSRKIFWSILTVALAVMVICVSAATLALYNQFTEEHLQQLWNETRLVRQAVNGLGLDYFADLRTSDFRITWITGDGRILYDNEAESASMENHLEREEVQDALKYGEGESERYSSTLAARQLYTAVRMDDGSVLRLSITQPGIPDIAKAFLVPGILLLTGVFFLSLFLAGRLSSRIVKPINELDLDNPLEQPDAYPEVRPLLERLEDQHEQIRKDSEELERISLIRQEFTANASHELKTPLHILSGYAELIENGMVRSEDIPRFAGRIRTEAQRMTKLVEDIIDLSQLDGGGDESRREDTDLYRIAVNTAETLQAAADEAGVQISVQGTPAVINGIPDVLYSMIYNLADNAIKYNNAGGHITISVEDSPQNAVLTVKDDGIGIPEKDRERIFERFYRVDKSRSKEVGGTGLGLSIVKHGSMIHNASIRVDSQEGSGSVFTIEFPKVHREM
ncbi:MAG: ATP-binding protein [Solobacterium sp.]|nr:ATP-binding protein [Solobacterium sp.]